MTKAKPNTYDEVSYPSYPFPQSHPDRLATLATLFGLKPARIDNCRVLEIGCGDGSNLIPMALLLPESEFVGVDLAARPVAKGQAMAEALGLRNITLQQLDIMNLSAEFGQFDYVIAHGVYSWVPAEARDKLLAICKANLSANGVAYVSYNAYPGGHLREMIRGMMQFHVRELHGADERISQSRALVSFLAQSQSESDLYGAILGSLDQELGRIHDGFVYHDHLSEINSPVYFHQFISHASQHGLQYLGEADYFDMHHEGIMPQAAEMLRELGDDHLAREQYMDFLTCRRFRQTLLCHQDVTVDRGLNPERISDLFVASSTRAMHREPVVDSRGVEIFQSDKAATLTTNHPLTKAALLHLGSIWPRALGFNELLAAARLELGPSVASRNGDKAPSDGFRLGEFLLQAYAANMIELHAHRSQFAGAASARPVASPLVRWQLETGTTVTTLRHTSVRVTDAIGRHLLMLLDGTRDRQALLAELGRLVESGQVVMQREGKEILEAREAMKALTDELEQNLIKIARLALLTA